MAGRSIRGPAAGPSLVAVVATAVLAGIVRSTGVVLGGPDPFWHWDLGRRVVHDWLPDGDPYSFLTTGRDWVLNQWGTEAVIGLADRVGGLWLVGVLGAMLVAAAYGHVGYRMWRRSPSLLTVALFGLVYMAGMSNLSLRGNLLSFVLLPIVLAEFQRDEGPRPIILLPVMALWANLHAGFLMGLAIMVVYSAGEAVLSEPGARGALVGRRTLLLLGALAATTITPYGPRLLVQSLALSLRGANSGISEWGAPTLTAPTVLPFTVLVAIALVAMGIAATWFDLPDVLLVVAFVLLGASATRNLAPAAIAVGITAAPYVRQSLMSLRRVESSGAPGPVGLLDRVAATVLAIVGVLVILATVPKTDVVELHAANVPIDIAEGLRTEDREIRAHVSSLWAPAVAILAGDHVRTSVDGRLELFSHEEIQAVSTVESANPGWLEQLDDWCVTDVVVDDDGAAGTYLADEPAWERVKTAVVIGTPGDTEAVWYRRRDLQVCSTRDPAFGSSDESH